MLNRYPLWKNLLVAFVLVLSAIYALPNIYPPDPAVQVSGSSSALEIDQATLDKATDALAAAGIAVRGSEFSARNALLRLDDAEQQLRAKSVIKRALGDDYVVALNLAPTTPDWLLAIGGSALKLGLDLSGGVHFLLQVDTAATVAKRLDIYATAAEAIQEAMPELQRLSLESDGKFRLQLALTEAQIREMEDYAVNQNLTTLRNRVNELGVSEPLIQKQGRNRIVVELPGVLDTAEAKRILGKTANLEFRLAAEPDAAPAAVDAWPAVVHPAARLTMPSMLRPRTPLPSARRLISAIGVLPRTEGPGPSTECLMWRCPRSRRVPRGVNLPSGCF